MPYFFNLPLINELTINQQAALNETEAIAISGGPGTGKSVVSLWRHIRNYALGSRKSLLLTYTITLETYLSASAASENAEAGAAISRTLWWTSRHTDSYDEIIVDEAQDVESYRYEIVRGRSKIVSYGADDQQIIFPQQCTRESELRVLFPNNRRHELHDNFRNSYEIMQFIRSLFPKKLISQATMNALLQNGKRGNKPILLITNYNSDKQGKAILDLIKQFRSETHNIAILVPLQSHVNAYCALLTNAGVKHSRFITGDGVLHEIDNVHVTTFKSCKGTEFDTIILPDFQNMASNIANLRVVEEEDYYVALTRAKRNLYLISSSEQANLNANTIQREIL